MTSERRSPTYGVLSVLCILVEIVLYRILTPWQPQSILAPLALLALPTAGVILGVMGRLRKDDAPWLAALGQILNGLILFGVCLLLFTVSQN
jgi:hypothetical protein